MIRSRLLGFVRTTAQLRTIHNFRTSTLIGKALSPRKQTIQLDHFHSWNSSSSSAQIPSSYNDCSVLNAGEILVKLRFGDGDPNYVPVKLFSKDSPKDFIINCIPYQGDDNLVDLQMSKYDSNDYFKPYTNYHEGIDTSIKRGSVLNYKVVAKGTEIGFQIIIKDVNKEIIGTSFISINQGISDYDEIAVPLLSIDNEIIGSISFYVLQVHSIHNTVNSSVEIHGNPYRSLRHYEPLEIGHRGCGITGTDKELQTSLPVVPENTIASMALAYLHGADMIETDVVVTQDFMPVLYHDLEFEVNGNSFPISSISYKTLKSLQSSTPEVDDKEAIDEQLFGQECEEIRQAIGDLIHYNVKSFPTLKQTLSRLPPRLGIMLEIKSNMPEEGSPSVSYHGSKNCFIDAILSDLLRFADDRPIILCSFCHSTCIMLRNKQSRWPVVLTVLGSTSVYSDFVDKRQASLNISKSFAISEKLYGLSVFSELIAESPGESIRDLNESGLSIFTWGHRNCDKDFRKRLRDAKVDGIIYDRIYEEDLKKNIWNTSPRTLR